MKQVRQQEILDLISEEGFVSTEALAAHFKVSSQTIRRDLDALEEQGLVTKSYGGATLIGGPIKEDQEDPRTAAFHRIASTTVHYAEKIAIATKTMDYVKDGMTIALDAGTTTRLLSPELAKKNNLIIITKDILLALSLYDHPTNKVYLVGGFVDGTGTASGDFVREFLETVSRIDLFILSTNGITVNEGFTSEHAPNDSFRPMLIPLAMKRIAISDHTKFGQVGFYRTCALTDIDHIITDSHVDMTLVDEMREAGADVVIAKSVAAPSI